MASIVELANSITKNVEQLSDYASIHGLAIPSFNVDAPVSWNIPPEAKEITAARQAALAAIKQLEAALLGPKEYFRSLVQDGRRNVPVQAVTRFQLAKAFPVGHEIAISDLAGQDNVTIPKSDLERILRFAVNMRIFEYGHQPGHIRHNAVSRLLMENEDIHDYAAVACDIMWSSLPRVIDALVKYPGSQEPNETGFNLAKQTNLTLYQYFEQYPRQAKEFSRAMDSFSKMNPGFDMIHTVNGFVWDELSQGVVVDVGGSGGHTVFALAEAFPDLQYIVQDLPAVVQAAVVPPRFTNNVKLMAHNFFEPQSVKHADVYILRWILHNWPDQYAIRILRSLIPALKVGSKVLICDDLMPPHGTIPREKELALCDLDMVMLAIQNAKLRSAEEWTSLLVQADPRFVLKGIKMPPGSLLAFIEAEWSADPQT